MSSSHAVPVSTRYIQMITTFLTHRIRFSAVEAARLLLTALIMVESLAYLLDRDDRLTLTLLLLHTWQPVLGLSLLPMM